MSYKVSRLTIELNETADGSVDSLLKELAIKPTGELCTYHYGFSPFDEKDEAIDEAMLDQSRLEQLGYVNAAEWEKGKVSEAEIKRSFELLGRTATYNVCVTDEQGTIVWGEFPKCYAPIVNYIKENNVEHS
ncbi:MAG: hypothetical protein ACO1OO_08585 [Flavisolibacter sp.]